MGDLPEHVGKLLQALVEIEDRATLAARLKGCKCSGPVPGVEGRYYPIASFNTAECIGKPLSQIPWELRHEPGCLMDGQKGVG
jgi:hypothetical protein